MSDYFNVNSRYFDSDAALEQPITAKPVPKREGAAPGTDPGGYLTSKIVGITTNPTLNQVEGLQAQIRAGASKVELGFMGVQKGNANSPTPESMTKTDREMIRDLAKINKVETTVHAAPSVSNLSGFSQNGFNEQQRESALNEIKRAVDFAADASTGGAVVVHYDEWQRPIEPTYGNHGQETTFQGYAGELVKKERKSEYFEGQNVNEYGSSQALFADRKSNQLQALPRNIELREPLLKKVSWDPDTQLLEYDYEKNDDGTPKTATLTYDDIVKLEEDLHNPEDPRFKDYNDHYDTVYGRKMREKWNAIQSETDERKRKDQIVLYHFMKNQAEQSYENYIRMEGELADIERNLSDENRIEQIRQKDPEYVNKLQRLKIQYGEQRDKSYARFMQQIDQSVNMAPLEDVSIEKSANTIADAALYAWERSQGNKHLNRNLYIAPESVFPESFGSHPDEMMKMIDKSREEMAEQLMKTEQFKDRKKAEEEAAKYIRATLDIGHMNMWRRHMKRKEGESIEDFNRRFNKWALEKSEEMAKKGYVGHGHISDNFGFGDEHLSVGEGNAPIREFVDKLRKSGKVDDFITEIGSYNANTAQMDAWSHLGISMGPGRYFKGTSRGSPGYFNQLRNQYVGRTRKPSYVYGKYVPQISSDKWQGWSPWTGSPI
ncbi:MAG: hypothetical protein ACOC32_03180 [Nanoarchaeota archaeon]